MDPASCSWICRATTPSPLPGRSRPAQISSLHHRPRLVLRLRTGSVHQAGDEHALFERMAGDMDLDCGTIAVGRETTGQAGQRIFDLMIEVASGRRTKSCAWGYGGEEFIPWSMGLTY